MVRNTRYRFIGLALIQTRRLKLKSQLSLQCGIEIVKKCCDTVSVIRQKGTSGLRSVLLPLIFLFNTK